MIFRDVIDVEDPCMDDYIENCEKYGCIAPDSQRIRAGLARSIEYLFNDIDLSGRSVLDVGAGDGKHTLYAAMRGANRVVAVEPLADGSSAESLDTLKQIEFDYNSVKVETESIQEFKIGEEFDVILLSNSVNHLNEAACKRIHEDKSSREIYRRLFEKLQSLTARDGVIILQDAGRYTIWSRLDLTNPLRSNINYHVHQPPHVWCELLEFVGYEIKVSEWLPVMSYGEIVSKLTANRLAAYFLKSQFRIVAAKDSF